MRYGNAACFLRVVLEVRLNKFIRVIADDFDGVFIGADRSVSAKSPELTADRSLRSRIWSGLFLQRMIGNVVYDSDGKVRFRLLRLEVLIYCEDALRRRIL